MIALTIFSYHGTGAKNIENVSDIDFSRPAANILQVAVPVIVLSAPLPKVLTENSLESGATSSTSAQISDLRIALLDISRSNGGENSVLNETIFEEEKTELQRELLSIPPPRSDLLGFLAESSGASSRSFYRNGGDLAPEIYARKALVADLMSKEAFFDLKSKERWPLASLTKLMTAAIVLRDVGLDQPVTIGATDFLPENHEQEKTFSLGDRYRVRDLLRAMLMASSNEAAEALANSYGRVNFIAAMNNQARDWGLDNTHFDDPTGLSASNQSTAVDIQELLSRIYEERSDILKITREKSWTIRELDTKKNRIVKNINLFAGQANFLGGKTGYTDEANGNLVSLFKYKERPVVVIILGSGDRFGETEKLFGWFKNNFTTGK